MKYLLIILISLPCFANSVPLSEAQRYIDAMPNGVPPLYTCSDKPEEPCFNTSEIVWEYAEIVTEFKVDIVNGINLPHKVLKNSPEKRALHEKEKKDKQDSDKAKKDKIKLFDKSKIKDVKDCAEAVGDLYEFLK